TTVAELVAWAVFVRLTGVATFGSVAKERLAGSLLSAGAAAFAITRRRGSFYATFADGSSASSSRAGKGTLGHVFTVTTGGTGAASLARGASAVGCSLHRGACSFRSRNVAGGALGIARRAAA